jgi:hypothetical protein
LQNLHLLPPHRFKIGEGLGGGRTDRRRQLLTPEFGKEYDMWVRFEKESVWWKERYFQRFSAEGSAVGYLLQFGKRIVELILRDWTVTWLDQRKRMDG